MKLVRLNLQHFLSYRDATLEMGDLVALVGQNSAGKSNVLKALKLLRDIPQFGLQTAIARRGGFDQLRHRSEGRPYDPSIRVEFADSDARGISHYELKLASVPGKRYEIKSESAVLYMGASRISLSNKRGRFEFSATEDSPFSRPNTEVTIPQGQSLVSYALGWGAWPLYQFLSALQPIEITPSLVGMLQDVTSTYEFEPDGSNTASVYEMLAPEARKSLVEELAAVVPGIVKIDVTHLADKISLRFGQEHDNRVREFAAKQMSDGTLRAFGILLGFYRPNRAQLIMIEEPETAIHLGALQTLVELLREHSRQTQVLFTTHSADIIDHLDTNEIRVVSYDSDSSQISRVAPHTIETIRSGLIGAGRLLKSGALDPALP